MDTRHGIQTCAEASTAVSAIPPQYDKPHIPPGCVAGLIAAHADKPLANVDHELVLSRLRGGETPAQLGKSLGISHQAVYEWLLKNYPEDWAAISASKALARLEIAEAGMDEAEDQVSISKARESHRMGQWTLEKVARRMYGDPKHENTGVEITVVIARDGNPVTTIEHAK